MAVAFNSIEEIERAASLLDAQTKAVRLFEEIERDFIRPGVSEKALSKEIHDLEPSVTISRLIGTNESLGVGQILCFHMPRTLPIALSSPTTSSSSI